MQLTKKLEGLFDRYQVKLRKGNSKVTHALYGSTVEINPVQFAVFETAIKALAVSWELSNWPQSDIEKFMQWQLSIAQRNGIELCGFSGKLTSEQAADDYRYC